MSKVSEVISEIGVRFYGDKFSISDKNIFESYKKTFEIISKNNKGCLVIGGIGAGKSAMMQVMQILFRDSDRRFKWVTASELKDMAEEMTTGQIKQIYGYDMKKDLYIDDIGFTLDVKRFGNTINIISELIMERYELFIATGIKTHLSSNLLIKGDENAATIEKLFGSRILDRMKEMCEIVTFNGTSLRK